VCDATPNDRGPIRATSNFIYASCSRHGSTSSRPCLLTGTLLKVLEYTYSMTTIDTEHPDASVHLRRPRACERIHGTPCVSRLRAGRLATGCASIKLPTTEGADSVNGVGGPRPALAAWATFAANAVASASSDACSFTHSRSVDAVASPTPSLRPAGSRPAGRDRLACCGRVAEGGGGGHSGLWPPTPWLPRLSRRRAVGSVPSTSRAAWGVPARDQSVIEARKSSGDAAREAAEEKRSGG
jgi:hypothetical protein